MKIAGLDLSMNSPGVFTFDLDQNLEIISKSFMGVSDKKGMCSNNTSLWFLEKKTFKDPLEKDLWVAEKVIDEVKGCEYVAIEGPAYSAKGRLFEIAQFTGCVKYQLYKQGIKIRVYDPQTIKIMGTNEGNSSKLGMFKTFIQEEGDNFFKSCALPNVVKEVGVSPTSDIVDAYWIARLLLKEIRLRRALDNLKESPEQLIRVFNRTSKMYPTNILDTDFLEKRK